MDDQNRKPDSETSACVCKYCREHKPLERMWNGGKIERVCETCKARPKLAKLEPYIEQVPVKPASKHKKKTKMLNEPKKEVENELTRTQRIEACEKIIMESLLEHPCKFCGEPDPFVLLFHGTEGKVSSLRTKGDIDGLKEAIKGKIVLCLNCNMRQKVILRKWWKTKYMKITYL